MIWNSTLLGCEIEKYDFEMNMLKIIFQSVDMSVTVKMVQMLIIGSVNMMSSYPVLKNGNEMCSVTGVECTVALVIHSFVSVWENLRL